VLLFCGDLRLTLQTRKREMRRKEKRKKKKGKRKKEKGKRKKGKKEKEKEMAHHHQLSSLFVIDLLRGKASGI